MGRKDELIDDACASFEDSTGSVPNDYEYSVIKVLAEEYVSNEEGKQD